MNLPHGAVGWSALCVCGISRSYLLTYLNKTIWGAIFNKLPVQFCPAKDNYT